MYYEADNWTMSFDDDDGDAEITGETEFHTGTKSLTFSLFDSETSDSVTMHQLVEGLTPSASYTGSFWQKSTGGTLSALSALLNDTSTSVTITVLR